MFSFFHEVLKYLINEMGTAETIKTFAQTSLLYSLSRLPSCLTLLQRENGLASLWCYQVLKLSNLIWVNSRVERVPKIPTCYKHYQFNRGPLFPEPEPTQVLAVMLGD